MKFEANVKLADGSWLYCGGINETANKKQLADALIDTIIEAKTLRPFGDIILRINDTVMNMRHVQYIKLVEVE